MDSPMFTYDRSVPGQLSVTPKFLAGQVVKLVGRRVRPTDAAKTWVVTHVNDKTATLFPLGGSPSGRYMRAPGSLLRVVENPKVVCGTDADCVECDSWRDNHS
jgi:hypothetical protein